jgi:eukaryotic-like serine/threonine-protein kinase
MSMDPDCGPRERADGKPPIEPRRVSTVAATGIVLVGRYELERQLGQGGMGAVWQARDLVLGRMVAVKIVTVAGSREPGAASRLRREARTVSALDNPHLARVYDLRESEDGDFIVMEFVDGESLAARLARDGRLTWALAARIASQCATALDAAHRGGVIHRDVKPSNIMLGAQGAKIIDFGIAATVDPDDTTMTKTQGVIGTVAYLAPERVTGAPATPASDLYALGVVLYQMLAGRLPFGAAETIAMLYAHMALEPDPLPDDTSPALAAICLGLLAKDPAARSASGADLASRLDSAALDPPAHRQRPPRRVHQPFPPSVPDSVPLGPAPARKYRPQRRALLLAGVLMVLVAAALSAWLTVGTGTSNAANRLQSPASATSPAVSAPARSASAASPARTPPRSVPATRPPPTQAPDSVDIADTTARINPAAPPAHRPRPQPKMQPHPPKPRPRHH